MQQLGLDQVIKLLGELLKSDQLEDLNKVPGIILPSLNQFPDNPALWFYTGFWQNKIGNNALAVEAWERSFQLEPQPMVLANLGAAMRETGRPIDARYVLEKADFLKPNDPAILTNIAGTYVNEGDPWPGIAAGEKAVELAGEDGQGAFNLALLHLEAGNYGRGFDLYATGHHDARDKRTYEGAEKLTRANFEKAKGSRLLVYGEQGIGDELMFSTLFADVCRDFKVIFDHHPRLGRLYATAPWANQVELHPTRKSGHDSWYTPGCADYSTPIANLGQFYRRTPESFAWKGPVYQADPDEIELNRKYLRELADGRKIIALAFRGGTIKTARTYRAIQPQLLEPLFARPDLMFVNIDYEDMTGPVSWISEQFGQHKCLWYPSIAWAWDYDHLGALMAACDATVTVCQSAAHLSAAMGLDTHVLVPSRPAWRYGLHGTDWYWYPSGRAHLHRQIGNEWAFAVKSTEEALKWE